MSKALDETLRNIEAAGFTPADIAFIGSYDGEYGCTWDEFIKLANEAEEHYYSGFGGQMLASDLTIIFKDNSYLEREEYDGSEGWRYISTLEVKEPNKKITTICNGKSWATVSEMNRPGGKYSDEALSSEPTSESDQVDAKDTPNSRSTKDGE